MASAKPPGTGLDIGRRKWLLSAAVGCGALLMTCLPDSMALFRYDRLGIAAGQPWRILTAHFVHINTSHLLHNLLGLALVCELLWTNLPVRHGLGIMLSAALAVSGALWWLQPAIVWYGGLSGVLHGLWAGCALWGLLSFGGDREPPDAGSAPSPSRRIGVAALIALAVKLGLDLLPGALITKGTGGIPVVPSAHWYGASMGLVYVVGWRLKHWWSASRRRSAAD